MAVFDVVAPPLALDYAGRWLQFLKLEGQVANSQEIEKTMSRPFFA